MDFLADVVFAFLAGGGDDRVEDEEDEHADDDMVVSATAAEAAAEDPAPAEVLASSSSREDHRRASIFSTMERTESTGRYWPLQSVAKELLRPTTEMSEHTRTHKRA